MNTYILTSLTASPWQAYIPEGTYIRGTPSTFGGTAGITGTLLTSPLKGTTLTLSNCEYETYSPSLHDLPPTLCACRAEGGEKNEIHPKHQALCIGDAEGPYCSACGAPNPGDYIDHGIGPYEYWGFKANHSDISFESTCCSAPLSASRSGNEPYLANPKEETSL